jgi:hypothetical protein
MKVLKKGNGAKSWSKKMRCTGNGNGGGGCGALLLVEAGDLYRTGSHHYDGSSEYYVTFYCPECKVMTDIENHTGPSPGKVGPGGRG